MMTVEELEAAFERHADKRGKAREIAPSRVLSQRCDMNAFMLLERLLPGRREGMIAAATHDEIWLSVDLTELAAAATDEDVADLVRCRVRWDEDGLRMFV